MICTTQRLDYDWIYSLNTILHITLLLLYLLAAVVLRNIADQFLEASTGLYLDLLNKCDPHPQDVLLLPVHFDVIKDTVLRL